MSVCDYVSVKGICAKGYGRYGILELKSVCLVF